jgi:hypothetical protein
MEPMKRTAVIRDLILPAVDWRRRTTQAGRPMLRRFPMRRKASVLRAKSI